MDRLQAYLNVHSIYNGLIGPLSIYKYFFCWCSCILKASFGWWYVHRRFLVCLIPWKFFQYLLYFTFELLLDYTAAYSAKGTAPSWARFSVILFPSTSVCTETRSRVTLFVLRILFRLYRHSQTILELSSFTIRHYDNLWLFVASVNVELDASFHNLYFRLEDSSVPAQAFENQAYGSSPYIPNPIASTVLEPSVYHFMMMRFSFKMVSLSIRSWYQPLWWIFRKVELP